MFSNTAYEALYQLIGLELHSRFIEVITGESFFKGIILIIFGFSFFITTIKFLSRYVPGSLIEKKHIPLSRFIQITACLFLGLAILRVGVDSTVNDYKGNHWSENPFIKSHFKDVSKHYKVSIVFELISKTAEELTALISSTIDNIFSKHGSQLKSPNFFYKSIMLAGSSTIEDQVLREKIQFYTEECFSKTIPSMEKDANQGILDRFFSSSSFSDQALNDIPLEIANHSPMTCLDLKKELNQDLVEYASKNSDVRNKIFQGKDISEIMDPQSFSNYEVSMALVNYYMDQHEGRLGIQKGAETPGLAGNIFRSLNRFFSWDGLLGALGFRDSQGAAEMAVRSQEFSEHLARAPHVAGFIKMVLIFIFPFLMFFVVAGRWRILLTWFWIYFSVLLWTPLWTLLYHVIMSISMSADVMEAFGKLHDGMSLYSAALINSRMYYIFSIYSWAQLLIATLTTGAVFIFIKPMLGAKTQEESPEFMDTSRNLAGAGTNLAGTSTAAEAAAVVL